jgi:RHS repeat-associated protein
MRASWTYHGGDLVGYELTTDDVVRTARLTRDPTGRVATAFIDGVEHRFSYDLAGQLVSVDDVTYEYDVAGRLVREHGVEGAVAFEHDAAGQLIRRRGDVGSPTTYEYDAVGRRVRETNGEWSRVLRWDALGRLAKIEVIERVTHVDVDALGELASVNGTPLMWDSADSLSPPAWIGGRAIIGPGSPWATAAAGEASWLSRDWQGTVGPLRDAWGRSSDERPGGLQLGFRGEVEFEGDVWLRNRVYEPSTREFLTPDPLSPVAGTSCAANPYHYAANNPIGLLDPLGLRPLTDQELRDISQRMARPPGWLVALTSSWTGLGTDLASSALYGVSPWMQAAYATRVSGYHRAGGPVRGHWRTTPSGRRVWIAPTYRSGGWVSSYLRGNPTTQAWRRAGRLAGPLGTIFSGIAGGADQYAEDFDNRKLSTSDRVGRTAGAAAGSAGLSWAGAEAGGALGLRGGTALGAAIGSVVPGVGTGIGGAVGGTVGAVGGAVVGSGAGSLVADKLSGVTADVGQWIGGSTTDALHAAGHTIDDSAGRARDATASAIKAITPF